MDTTYWGKTFGVMLFKDAYTKENLLKYYVKSETNTLYLQGVNELKKKVLRFLPLFVMDAEGCLICLEMFLFRCASSIKQQL